MCRFVCITFAVITFSIHCLAKECVQVGFSWNFGVRNLGFDSRLILFKNTEIFLGINQKRYNPNGIYSGIDFYLLKKNKIKTRFGYIGPSLGMLYEYTTDRIDYEEYNTKTVAIAIPSATYFIPQIGLLLTPHHIKDTTSVNKLGNIHGAVSFHITYSVPNGTISKAEYLYGDRMPDLEDKINKFLRGGVGWYFSARIDIGRRIKN